LPVILSAAKDLRLLLECSPQIRVRQEFLMHDRNSHPRWAVKRHRRSFAPLRMTPCGSWETPGCSSSGYP